MSDPPDEGTDGLNAILGGGRPRRGEAWLSAGSRRTPRARGGVAVPGPQSPASGLSRAWSDMRSDQRWTGSLQKFPAGHQATAHLRRGWVGGGSGGSPQSPVIASVIQALLLGLHLLFFQRFVSTHRSFTQDVRGG